MCQQPHMLAKSEQSLSHCTVRIACLLPVFCGRGGGLACVCQRVKTHQQMKWRNCSGWAKESRATLCKCWSMITYITAVYKLNLAH